MIDSDRALLTRALTITPGTTHSDETSNVDMSLASNDSEALQEAGSQQLDSSQILSNVCQMLQSDKVDILTNHCYESF